MIFPISRFGTALVIFAGWVGFSCAEDSPVPPPVIATYEPPLAPLYGDCEIDADCLDSKCFERQCVESCSNDLDCSPERVCWERVDDASPVCVLACDVRQVGTLCGECGCQAGAFCGDDDSCHTKGESGAACTRDEECLNARCCNGQCSGNMVEVKGSEVWTCDGEVYHPCSSDLDCADSLSCISEGRGWCEPEERIDAPLCYSDKHCTERFGSRITCEGILGFDRVGGCYLDSWEAGAYCVGDDWCTSRDCRDEVCFEAPDDVELGGACENDEWCDQGRLCCPSGIGAEKVCSHDGVGGCRFPIGAACTYGSDCVSSTCETGVCVAQ